jgi:carbon monoxide dehydrogenase subunit G
MEVELNKKYPLAVSADSAWAVLADIRAVGGCMPGAQITDQVDATHYKGTVRSKVGPATMSFAGDIEVLKLDTDARTLELLGKGADKGGSSAQMKLLARLEPGADEGSCVLVGDATVTVSGKLAQFGGRLLVPIADAMLQQFAGNFENAARAVPAVAGAAAAPVEAAAREATPVVAESAAATTADAAPAVQPASVATARPVSAAAPVPAKAAPKNELNALGLMWIVIRGWFLGLFGKKAS